MDWVDIDRVINQFDSSKVAGLLARLATAAARQAVLMERIAVALENIAVKPEPRDGGM
jgi:hypothetical protein